MNLSNFRPGDLLVITERLRTGTERRAAQVSCVDYNGNGLVTYTPPDVSRDSYAKTFGVDVRLDTGSGAFAPKEYSEDGYRLDLATRPFGLAIRVEKVGYRRPWTPSTISLVGNPGYDLMHDPRRF